jgi:hypothetical protein
MFGILKLNAFVLPLVCVKPFVKSPVQPSEVHPLAVASSEPSTGFSLFSANVWSTISCESCSTCPFVAPWK